MNARTKKQDLVNSTALSAPTRHELLETVANMFERAGEKTFSAIPDVENRPPHNIETVPMASGSIMHAVAQTLNSANVPTGPNVGDVMKNLNLDKDQVHELACACMGASPTGTDLARRFRDVARRQ